MCTKTQITMYRLILSILLLSSLTACQRNNALPVEKSAQNYDFKVHFENDKMLSDVLDKAKADNKLVYVDIGTKWCLPCQLMKEDVYTDVELGAYMNDRFINYLVDAEKGEGPDLKLMFEVKSYPTLLFIDYRGRVVARKTGAAYHRELKALAKEALLKI